MARLYSGSRLTTRAWIPTTGRSIVYLRIPWGAAYYLDEDQAPLLTEAQVAAHFPIIRGFSRDAILRGSGFGVNLFLTTQIRIRALDAESGPIQSPSFMPRLVVQGLTAIQPDRRWSGARNVLGVQLAVGHHSNGGEGCVFADQVLGSDGRCRRVGPGPTEPRDRRVRLNPGNFSTNYWDLGVYWRSGVLRARPRSYWLWSVDAGIGFQRHHAESFPLPGGAHGDFARMYGASRPRIELAAHLFVGQTVVLQFRGRHEWFRVPDEAEPYPGSDSHRTEWRLVIQTSPNPVVGGWVRRALNQLGFGVRFVDGQDYYNVQFVRDVRTWQFLITLDPWSPWVG